MTQDNMENAKELETFLPQDGSNVTNGVTKYKVVKPDVEAAEFDPFKARILEHPVSDCDTLTHLLKASLGTGILSMPAAFASSGLILGIFATIITSAICTHCSYILVVCAHELYKRSGKTEMSFAEVAEEACLRGPKWGRKFAYPARMTVLIGIFVTYFSTCSCYSVIIAKNFQNVLIHYLGEEGWHHNDRIIIAALLVPLVIMAWVPNLKYLAPFSMVANAFMGIGLGITMYYLVIDLPPITERALAKDVTMLPMTVSITIFAIEAIGVVMPLENHMEKPRHFVGLCGVLNQGMSAVTLIYILLGFLGYFKFGDDVKGSVTLDLPKEEIPAQIVLVLIGLAVYFTFGLQFYVCIDIAWNGIKERFTNNPMVANYIMRTVMVTTCVLLAVAVPTITPFVALIGAFFFSILGLMTPVYIEMITFWGQGFGKYNYKIFKNIVVVIAAIMALVFGSKQAIENIVDMYMPSGNVTEQTGNRTEFIQNLFNATFGNLTSDSV